MSAKKKGLFIALAIILLLLLLLSFLVPQPVAFQIYSQHVFFPYQRFRSSLLGELSFSLGDVIYILVFLLLLLGIFRFFYFLFRRQFSFLLALILRSSLSILVFFLIYFYGWGANYNRAKIWTPITNRDTVWNRNSLIALNDTLVNALNSMDYVPSPTNLQEANDKVRKVYKDFLGGDIPYLEVKPTLFGSSIYYIGIQGYYNPFTGEAQLEKHLPKFMWGFVISHEMAHQVGIAAEGEANFMAYVIGIKSKDPELNYSAYFNLFLYANGELSRKDSILATEKRLQLMPIHQKNIAELKEIRAKYRSIFRGTALDIYNWMLQSQGQGKGLKSYSDISRLVYLWEKEGEPDLKFLNL